MKSRFSLVIVCLISILTSSLSGQECIPGPIVVIIGTRPEAIKMVPVYEALKADNLPVCLCTTGQHTHLVDEILALYGLKPDCELKIMKPGQDLFYITKEVMEGTKKLFEEIKPSLVLVQGDTTSAMSAALAAFYLKIPIGHVEAGLRTWNMQAPFPEEMNRRVISLISSYHFAPTTHSVSNLLKEGIDNSTIFCTGNTVVDALYSIKEKIEKKEIFPDAHLTEIINSHKARGDKIVLLTAHRRESFGDGLKHIFTAIREALLKYPNLFIIYPKHPNPEIQRTIEEVELNTLSNIMITSPLSYENLIYVLDAVDGVATDSGGIQEEAVSLGKPLLILRNETDRPEGLEEDFTELVGTDEEKILRGIKNIMETKVCYPKNSKRSIYSEGDANKKISAIIKNLLFSK